MLLLRVTRHTYIKAKELLSIAARSDLKTAGPYLKSTNKINFLRNLIQQNKQRRAYTRKLNFQWQQELNCPGMFSHITKIGY